jgi:hypothetical protein
MSEAKPGFAFFSPRVRMVSIMLVATLLATGCLRRNVVDAEATESSGGTAAENARPGSGASGESPASDAARKIEPPAMDRESEATDRDLSRFAPQGFMVRLQQRGDIDGDGDEDAVLVLQSEDDEDRFEPRPLLVLRRNANGRLEKVVQNDKAILCASCGGMAGDPLTAIKIDSNGFSLDFEGVSRALWSRDYVFDYSAIRHAWMLKTIRGGALDRISGNHVHDEFGESDFGSIPIEGFDPAKLPTYSLP